MIWPLNRLLETWAVYTTKFPQLSATSRAKSTLRLTPSRDQLAKEALRIMIGEIGRGESGGNNLGPDVARYVFPAKPPQNWCAGVIGYCYEVAAFGLGIELPFKRSLGAKALGRNVAAYGRRFMDPREAQPGDLMIFSRGMKGSWHGHVAMVESQYGGGLINTIEGNSGPKVMRLVRAANADQARFAFFASVRKEP